MTIVHPFGRSLAIAAVAALVAACADAPLVPARAPATTPPAAPQLTTFRGDHADVISTIQQATARYHNLEAALADDFVFLHGCENRPDEGPVGTVYVHLGRLLDGVIDPGLPDALIYESRENERPRLVGVELAVPVALWTNPEPPAFLGAEFQREDEFGVFGLHVWVWRDNPEGLFAESNPRVSCETV